MGNLLRTSLFIWYLNIVRNECSASCWSLTLYIVSFCSLINGSFMAAVNASKDLTMDIWHCHRRRLLIIVNPLTLSHRTCCMAEISRNIKNSGLLIWRKLFFIGPDMLVSSWLCLRIGRACSHFHCVDCKVSAGVCCSSIVQFTSFVVRCSLSITE